MNKGHRNQSMYFYFEDEKQLERFIDLFGDLFAAYSESLIREQSHCDREIIEQMKKGYRIDPFKRGDKTFIRVNLYPEGRKEILSAIDFTVTHEISKQRYETQKYRQPIYTYTSLGEI